MIHPMNDNILETRIFAMENDARHLRESMESLIQTRINSEPNSNWEYTRLMDLEATQAQVKNTLSTMQDQQSVLEDLQNSMDGQLRELDACIRTVKTTYPTNETMDRKMQQLQDTITQQMTTQAIATQNWVISNTITPTVWENRPMS